MIGEREYINKMKIKILESVDKNEFDLFLMGEKDYIVSSRGIPVLEPGTGNLYNYMMTAIRQLQNDVFHYEWRTVLLNAVERIIDKGPYGILNAVEVIRSILNAPVDTMELLNIEKEDIKDIVEKIRTESIRQSNQLKGTISPSNKKMSVYDCLIFYCDYIYKHTGVELVQR